MSHSRQPGRVFRTGQFVLVVGLATIGLVPASSAGPGDTTWIQSSSKYTESTSTAPGSITIITAEDIATHGYATLAEALASVRGIHTSYDRAFDATGMRGYVRANGTNSGILVMIDGHRINDPVYNSAATGTNFPLDMNMVERIEVTRGGASAVHGNDASLGMVNVITKRFTEPSTGRVSAMAASYDTYAGGFQFGRRTNDDLAFQVAASATGQGGQGLHFADFNEAQYNFGNTDPETDESSFLKLHGGLEMGAWQMTAFHVTRDKHIPVVSASSLFNDPRRLARDERTGVDLSTTSSFGTDAQVSARFYYDRYGLKLNDPREITSGSSPLEFLGRLRAESQMFGTDAHLTRQHSEIGTLLIGAEYRNQFQIDQEVNDDIDGVTLDVDRSGWDWSFYGQEEVRLGDDWRVALGVRHDEFKSFGGTTNPRASVVWDVDANTTFKATAGQSFLAPTPFEEFFIDPSFAKPNANLMPETMRSAEVIGSFALGHTSLLTLGGFWQSIDDRIAPVFDSSDGLFYNDNTDEARVAGLDAEFETTFTGGVRAVASYTYQDGEDRESGEWLVNSPKHLGKFNLRAPLSGNQVIGGVELRYMSERLTAMGNEVDPNFLANVTVNARHLLGGVDVAASVLNVLDESYSDPTSGDLLLDAVEQNGRNFRLRVGYGF